MNLRHLGLLLVVALVAISRAALAQSDDFKLVLFGKITQVEGRTVQYIKTDGTSGTIEFSPKAVTHDATQPVASSLPMSEVKTGDIFVLAVDSAGKTHLVLVRDERATHREWDAVFVRIIPGYTTIHGPSPSPSGAPSDIPAGEKYKVVGYGKITAIVGEKLTIQMSPERTASVTVPKNAVYHDAAQAFGATSPSSQLQVGDEILMTADPADVPHVLFLHPGAKLHPSWQGHLTRG